MISDKERRAVAARMREIMRDNPDEWLDIMVSRAMVDVLRDVAKFGETVADLVDRPTCRNLSFKSADEFICSACGERVDIACLDNADDYHANYCPRCGALVVNDD